MRQPARVFALFFCGFAAVAAHAGVLYKCSDAKGAVTIQSDPCPTGSKEIWKRDSAPVAQPTLQQVVANSKNPAGSGPAVAHAAAPAPAAPPPGPLATAAGTNPTVATPPLPAAPPPPAVAPALAGAVPEPTIKLSPPRAPTTANPDCDAAKTFAASVREKIWLDLNQEQMGRLYSWVMNECSRRNDSDDNGQ